MKGLVHIVLVLALLTQAVAYASIDADGCNADGSPHSAEMQHGSDHHSMTAPMNMPMGCCDDGIDCASNCELNVPSAMVMTLALSVAQNSTRLRLDRLADRVARSHPAPDLRPPISI